MQPYLDQYKLAEIIGTIADKTGKVHYKNLLGFADVEAKKPISEDNVSKTGMVAIFMVQCTSGDQWAVRGLFLKTAAKIFPR
jgi:hypothetical protein